MTRTAALAMAVVDGVSAARRVCLPAQQMCVAWLKYTFPHGIHDDLMGMILYPKQHFCN